MYHISTTYTLAVCLRSFGSEQQAIASPAQRSNVARVHPGFFSSFYVSNQGPPRRASLASCPDSAVLLQDQTETLLERVDSLTQGRFNLSREHLNARPNVYYSTESRSLTTSTFVESDGVQCDTPPTSGFIYINHFMSLQPQDIV